MKDFIVCCYQNTCPSDYYIYLVTTCSNSLVFTRPNTEFFDIKNTNCMMIIRYLSFIYYFLSALSLTINRITQIQVLLSLAND